MLEWILQLTYIFQALKVVDCGSETQLQVTEAITEFTIII